MLRRSITEFTPEPTVEVAGFVLNPASRIVRHRGTELSLTAREFDLLAFFLRRPNQVFSRGALIKAVWGWDFGDLSTVTVHVRRLREKIEAVPTAPVLLKTVWGVGYRFDDGTETGTGRAPMNGRELLTIVSMVFLWAVAIGAVTVVLQRMFRRASIVLQILLVVLATVAVLVAGMVSAFNAMFISAKDLQVMWFILAVASVMAVAGCRAAGRGAGPPHQQPGRARRQRSAAGRRSCRRAR